MENGGEKMDVIEKKIKHERNKKYHLLRKFRKARDTASKHLRKEYSCNFLRKQITRSEEFDWFSRHSKNELAVKIYEWCKKNIED